MNPECPTTPERSAIMRAVKSRDTKPEVLLRSLLWRRGLRFRKHRRDLPGSPDAAFASAKVALFVDGDFWHGRLAFREGKAPVRNRGFWLAKFGRNRERDRRVDSELLALGWLPVRVWESDLKAHPGRKADWVEWVVKSRTPAPPARPPRPPSS